MSKKSRDTLALDAPTLDDWHDRAATIVMPGSDERAWTDRDIAAVVGMLRLLTARGTEPRVIQVTHRRIVVSHIERYTIVDEHAERRAWVWHRYDPPRSIVSDKSFDPEDLRPPVSRPVDAAAPPPLPLPKRKNAPRGVKPLVGQTKLF